MEEIQRLSKECLSDEKKINNLVKLLGFCDAEQKEKIIVCAVKETLKVFEFLQKSGKLDLSSKDGEKNAKEVYRCWIKENFHLFFESLLKLTEKSAAVASLSIYCLLSLLKFQFDPTKEYLFPNDLYFLVLEKVLALDDVLVLSFVSSYFDKFEDLRFYCWRNLKKFVDQKGFNNNLLLILLKGTKPSADSLKGDYWINVENKGYGFQNVKGHQIEFSECWLEVLMKLPSTSVYHKVLGSLHDQVIPFMANPCLLIDFLTDSYNRNGITSILALNGLFLLITKHNLDYPDFFIKLYALFDKNIFHLKYRSRFFKLVDLFLQSTLLPSYLVASFIKKIARLSLQAPPSSIIWVIPFIYNLIKRHPKCVQMIHRVDQDKSLLECQAFDVFNFDEIDPSKTRAIESSLWELDCLFNHYHHGVATMTSIFKEKLNKPDYKIEDFVNSSYQTLIDVELSVPYKNCPPLKSPLESSIFSYSVFA